MDAAGMKIHPLLAHKIDDLAGALLEISVETARQAVQSLWMLFPGMARKHAGNALVAHSWGERLSGDGRQNVVFVPFPGVCPSG
jgi:hypothetical protein